MAFPTIATLQRLLGQYGVTYLSRANWGHTTKLGPSMPGYARGVHVHHSVTLADDDGDYRATEDVVADMKEIERIGVQRFGRFSYSFAIHPSGVVAEGAGFTIGAHTKNYNSSTFGIVFIGNLDNDPLTRPMISAFKALVTVLRLTDALTDDNYFKPHRERKATSCPGQHVIDQWANLTNLSTIPVPPKETDDMTPDEKKKLAAVELRGIAADERLDRLEKRVGTDNEGLDLADEIDLLRRDSRSIGAGINALLKLNGLPLIEIEA